VNGRQTVSAEIILPPEGHRDDVCEVEGQFLSRRRFLRQAQDTASVYWETALATPALPSRTVLLAARTVAGGARENKSTSQ